MLMKKTLNQLMPELTKARYNSYAKLGRYSNQIGTHLLFIPWTWGIGLGAANPVSFGVLATMGIFYFGAFNLRSAGCAVNDYFDKEFDKQVERTKNRPLASGELTNIDALKFTGVHLSGGLLTLYCLKAPAVIQSLMIFPLAMAYPLAKRYTNYAQVVLGMWFSSGVLIGFSHMTAGAALAPVIPFYFAGIMWTMIYDSVYALQDTNDDKKIGLKGLAVKWGSRTKMYSARCNVIMTAALLAGGVAFDMNIIYYIGTLINFASYHHKIKEIVYKDPKTFHTFFMESKRVGLIILLLIIIGQYGRKKNVHKIKK